MDAYPGFQEQITQLMIPTNPQLAKRNCPKDEK